MGTLANVSCATASSLATPCSSNESRFYLAKKHQPNRGKAMATSKKRRKTKRATRSNRKKFAKEIAVGDGPVSLAEAKTLAQTKNPKLAVHAARKTAVPPA